jgi:hypothetical protein
VPQIDLEPIGRWERLIQPMRNKFTLHADMGLDTRLDPEAARATADAFETLARYIDLMETGEHLTRQLLKLLGGAALLIAASVALVYFA